MTATTKTLSPGAQSVKEEADHIASALAVTTADLTTAAIDCRGYDRIEMTIKVKAAGDPVGALYVLRALDDVAAQYAAVAIDANKMDTTDATAITHTSADYRKIVVNDPAADAYIQLIFTDLPSFLKVFWDWTSGGAASAGITVSYKLIVSAAR